MKQMIAGKIKIRLFITHVPRLFTPDSNFIFAILGRDDL